MKNIYSFKQWCEDNNRQDLINRWDTILNGDVSPSDISYKSNKKYWFKCPCGKHSSQLQSVQYFPGGKQTKMVCKGCESFAQYIIDNELQYHLKQFGIRTIC